MITAAVFLLTVSGALALGGARERKLLHSTLFDNYTTSVRPCLDYSRPTNVTVKLIVYTIMGLDIKNQILSINGFLSFKWTDELLTWSPDDYGGIKDMVVPQGIIWKPDMAVYNSVEDDTYLGGENLLADVNFKGEVRWEPLINLDATCQVDISQYPFDENVCTLEVTSWMNDNSSVVLLPAEEPIDIEGLVTNSQFWITAEDAILAVDEFSGKFYSTIYFYLKLKRRPAYLAMTLLTPVTLLAVLCVVSFLLTPEEPEKVSVAITILLSFTVFLGVIDTDLPESSDNISLIVVYVDTLLLLSFLSVAGNAVVIVIHRRDLRTAEDHMDIGGSNQQTNHRHGEAPLKRADNFTHPLPLTVDLNESTNVTGQVKNVGESSVSSDQTSIDSSQGTNPKPTKRLMMPITMLAIMCAVPYLLSPSEPEKLMLAITVLLSFTVIIDFISGRIPQNSEHVSILVIYMTLLFIQSFLSVVFNAIVLIVNILDERHHTSRHITKDIPTSEGVHLTEQTTPSKKRLMNFLLGHAGLWKDCSKLTDKLKIRPPSQEHADKPKTLSRAYKLNKVFLVINIFSLLTTSLVSWILLVS